MIEIKTGEGVSFSSSTSSGRIKVGCDQFDSPSTSFRATRSPRFPKPGDQVQVVLKTTDSGSTVLGVCADDRDDVIVKCVCSGDPPANQSDGASGVDLQAAEHMILLPGERCLMPTGIRVAVPVGYEGQVRSRSGLTLEHGVMVLNSPGTIDSDCRGEVKVIVANMGKVEFEITPGMRIAQLVFAPVTRVRLVKVDTLDDTDVSSKACVEATTHEPVDVSQTVRVLGAVARLQELSDD